MKFNVMFVDDSISVLESLQWIFRDEPYYLFAFDNPFDALKVTKTLEWAVVVADKSMQNMDGLEFLKRFQAQSPRTMGIIMTGYNEMKEAMDTLSPGCVYRFVKKPLNHIEIKQAVKTAISAYEANTGAKRHAIV
ncbi:MAG: response regulator [Desulfobacteraceae bacterium]|nr:response regulator [Desulfobacteraceae bacterium]